MRFALDDQIAAQPEPVARIVSREMPRPYASRPVVFTGIGTSLHAARVAVAWTWLVSGGRVRATAVDSRRLALCYPPIARTDPWMRPFTSIMPLQRLTAELARLRHTDPDTPHGGVEP